MIKRITQTAEHVDVRTPLRILRRTSSAAGLSSFKFAGIRHKSCRFGDTSSSCSSLESEKIKTESDSVKRSSYEEKFQDEEEEVADGQIRGYA